MPDGPYIIFLASLRILSLTPWSAKERDMNVDSAMPGKALGGSTDGPFASDDVPNDRGVAADDTHRQRCSR